MLFQVGGEGARPTSFEMAAAQQLPSSLRAALTYSIGVMALRRPLLHKVLNYEDEFFALLILVLEGHSLRTTDASFAESLYGLRRRAVKIKVPVDDTRLKLGDGIEHSGLKRRQRILSVVFLVVLPYLKSKLHSVYNREKEARLQARLWGNDDDTFRDSDYFEGDHSLIGGLSFTYQLLYLLDATGFYSLGLHALGIHDCRATGQELMDTSSRISKIRSRERERLRGPPWLKAVQGALLSCMYAVLDYAQTGLIAAVFIFKMMEWWYQSAEERMSAPTVNCVRTATPTSTTKGCQRRNFVATGSDYLSFMLPETSKPFSCHSLWLCLLLRLHIQICFPGICQ